MKLYEDLMYRGLIKDMTNNEDFEKKLNEGGYTAKVTEDSIRVRAEKSTDAEILGLAGVGSTYTCNEKDNGDGWVEIDFEGQKGYISSQYVTVDEITKTAVAE